MNTYTRTYNDQGDLVRVVKHEMATRGRRYSRNKAIKQYAQGFAVMALGLVVLLLIMAVAAD